MKELTKEQKAKAYDKALERAKDFMNGEVSYALKRGENIMCWIFPELKESEDEKIRKAIICGMNALKEQKRIYFAGIYIDDCITWLEKQCEQNHTNLPQFTFDDILALQSCMAEVKDQKELYKQLRDLHDRVHDAYHLEKQGK